MQYGDDDNSYDTSDKKKNPMLTELRKKMFVHFCMNCMRNYVRQDANCIAAPVREEKKILLCFLSLKLPKLCHIFMHFETALPETQC